MSESFSELFQQSIGQSKTFEGSVTQGEITAITSSHATVDVGLKSEGRIPLHEFGNTELRVGDKVDVYVDRIENAVGEAVLSREKACREAAWTKLEVAAKNGEHIPGKITGRVKGGFTVDLAGAVAFLPGSQLDLRPIKDPNPLIGIEQPFKVLKMDRMRSNIVVSRRAVLEETAQENGEGLADRLSVGDTIEGVVKNITDYGAFVDLGTADGLLHVTDISWNRVNHPSEVLAIGEKVSVQVIRISPETQRISLGIKQLTPDPWINIESTLSVGDVIEGSVTNMTDYGVFVRFSSGIEGLIHVSELSWTQKAANPQKVLEPGQTVSAKVLEIDATKRRISLSLKQCLPNPWQTLQEQYPIGSDLEGPVKNTTEFGVFISLPGDIDGMIHVSDISWDSHSDQELLAQYKKGDMVKARVLDIDVEKERINLGIKQLTSDPFADLIGAISEGDVLTCTVTSISNSGISVTTSKGIPGFIRKADLSRDRSEQRSSRFAVDERVDARVIGIDQKNRRVQLSIKARELEEEKEVMAAYGSSDSGASLGDILASSIDLDKVKEKATKKDEK